MTYFISIRRFRRLTIYRYIYITPRRHVYYELCVCAGRICDKSFYDRDNH